MGNIGEIKFRQVSENELELEVTRTETVPGIYYTPIEGRNHIELYTDDVLILDKEFEWEYSFVQDYIELTDRKRSRERII